MKYLYAIADNNMYIDGYDEQCFTQDEVYVWELDDTYETDEVVCREDDRDKDPHYADLGWLFDNFEVYKEVPMVEEVTRG